jgi:hypothetical protein
MQPSSSQAARVFKEKVGAKKNERRKLGNILTVSWCFILSPNIHSTITKFDFNTNLSMKRLIIILYTIVRTYW